MSCIPTSQPSYLTHHSSISVYRPSSPLLNPSSKAFHNMKTEGQCLVRITTKKPSKSPPPSMLLCHHNNQMDTCCSTATTTTKQEALSLVKSCSPVFSPIHIFPFLSLQMNKKTYGEWCPFSVQHKEKTEQNHTEANTNKKNGLKACVHKRCALAPAQFKNIIGHLGPLIKEALIHGKGQGRRPQK